MLIWRSNFFRVFCTQLAFPVPKRLLSFGNGWAVVHGKKILQRSLRLSILSKRLKIFRYLLPFIFYLLLTKFGLTNDFDQWFLIFRSLIPSPSSSYDMTDFPFLNLFIIWSWKKYQEAVNGHISNILCSLVWKVSFHKHHLKADISTSVDVLLLKQRQWEDELKFCEWSSLQSVKLFSINRLKSKPVKKNCLPWAWFMQIWLSNAELSKPVLLHLTTVRNIWWSEILALYF